ncbi:hypothetical protein RND71_036510 [Anisodus tanguticus]|uniref:Uncharacterized protein n=1 Tax=Anisodus tanguticus TaxID=243964 RepID=A0AAE1R1U6_9SOLA|nr:hypothetical protein RND71_036510 [Anisodus tanguticus]
MAYAAITSLMSTIDQSTQLISYNLLPFYEKFEFLRAILDKPCKIAGHLEAFTSLEAEIIELACSTEDLVDSESRKVFLAENEITRKIDIWELRFVLKQALGHIDSAINKWMAMRPDTEDQRPQNLTLSA